MDARFFLDTSLFCADGYMCQKFMEKLRRKLALLSHIHNLRCNGNLLSSNFILFRGYHIIFNNRSVFPRKLIWLLHIQQYYGSPQSTSNKVYKLISTREY